MACAQNCANDSTGLIPISELGTQYFNNKQGGLYGIGNNAMPMSHQQAGLEAASLIIPRNIDGNYDPNGKIGFISIGMSNCNLFFSGLRDSTLNFPERNNRLIMVNGATGGQDIDAMLDLNSTYWTSFDQKMAQSNLHDNQVQVIWFMQAKHITGIPSNEGLNHIEIMEAKFLQAFQYFKQRFPNLQQIYCSGRDYGGYNNPGSGNPEPYAYYTGWAFRNLVERQMAGDEALSFSSPQANTAWLAWADYVWVDGKNTRTDGFNWLCPNDVQNDGVHPNGQGRAKVASLLFNFYKSHPCTFWYRMNTFLNITDSNPALEALQIFPNPIKDVLHLAYIPNYSSMALFDFSGRLLIETQESTINTCHLPKGSYLLEVKNTLGNPVRKFVVKN